MRCGATCQPVRRAAENPPLLNCVGISLQHCCLSSKPLINACPVERPLDGLK